MKARFLDALCIPMAPFMVCHECWSLDTFAAAIGVQYVLALHTKTSID